MLKYRRLSKLSHEPRDQGFERPDHLRTKIRKEVGL